MNERPDDPEDRYLRHRMLGEGGAGRVWLVEDRLRPGTFLALKELTATGPARQRHEQELRREYATLASLHHPNLVEVHEFESSAESLPRFTLEFIQGRNIVDAVAHEGPGTFMEIAVEALRALAFLHDSDLIHRDIKPDNLLVRDQAKLGCRLVMVDFGLALPRGEPLESFKAEGTLPYLAPELLHGASWTRRSDLYALGAVLHEAVFGHAPFVLGQAELSRFVEAVNAGRRSRPPLPPGFPAGLAGWLDEMLSPEPGNRPSMVAESLARLNAACGTNYPGETPASRTARLRSGLPAERRTEISRIWRLIEPAETPTVVWLCGAPGTGRTRVLRWLESEATLKGWEVVGPEARSRTALRELRVTAGKRPTLLLIDDLDAAGGGAVDLVERVAREGQRAPVQIVAALSPAHVRHPALQRLFSDTGTVPTLSKVVLGRLDEAGVRAMACRATGGPVSDERVRWLLDTSEGLPALAESLLIEGTWERGGPRGASARAARPLSGRLELLDSVARRWLESLAVIDRAADESLLARLTGLDPETARGAAAEVAASGLAYLKGGLWFPDSRGLAENLREMMEPARRRALHLQAAEQVTEEQGERADPWLLARLWYGGGDSERAVRYAILAAERSGSEGDPAESAARYAQALRFVERRDPRRRDLRTRQAESLTRAGLYTQAARAYGAALRLANTVETRIAAMTAQAAALVHTGRFRRALAVARQAAALSDETGDREQLAQARKVAGIGLGRLGKESEAIPLLESARDLLRQRNNVAAEAEVVQVLAACRLRLGAGAAEADFLQAIDLYRRAREEHPESADDGGELKSRIGLAVIRARRGRYEDAIDILEQVRRTAVEQGNLNLQEAALSRLASVAIDQGRLDRAIELAKEAADLALHLGDHNLILLDQMRRADALIRCGRPGEAISILQETMERPLAQVEPENVDYARMLLADAWLESGGADEEDVRALLEQSRRGCRERRKPRPLLMAMVIEMERRARPDCPDPMDPLAAEFEATLERFGHAADPEIRTRADLALAGSHLCRGNAEAARAASERARRHAEAGGSPSFSARAHALLAEASSRLDRPDLAKQAFGTGRQLLDDAAAMIESDEVREAFLKRPVFAALRREGSPAGRAIESRLLAMYDMIRVLNSATDPDDLLESILDMALKAVRARRGMILLKPGGERGGEEEFSVRLARNLEEETVRDAESYSRSIVRAAGAGQSLLAIDAGDDQRFRDLKSVTLYDIRSLMCVPLRSRGRVIGTVYLDSRRDGVMFGPDDLRFLEAFADHAALALENTRARVRLEQQNRRLQAAADTRTEFANLVGRSPGMQAVFALIEKVATTELPVLIHGESGTGKELVARAIHSHGARRRRTFLTENCAAIPESLLESELFGHVRGAFTGAERSRPGLFEQADRGTLFLDEIGDMSAGMQARLLRVLEDGEIRRVGGEKPIKVDVRVLAASHRNLAAEVKAGRFRQDLLYRLQVLAVELPPLRERPGDVGLLTAHFLKMIAKQRGRDETPVDEEVLSLFERYRWPGNVRELENTLQRLVLLAGRSPVTLELIESDAGLRRTLLRDARSGGPLFSLELGEREQILRALQASQGNRRKAADLLGVSRATIYRKIRQHRL